MTKAEAIEILRANYPDACYEQLREAVNMAIEALETDVPDTNVGDMISRQAVLNYIDNMPSELTADGRRMIRRIRLTEYIQDSLPSVQPEPSEITDEQAILHLQSTGWMQNHDREMYESGLRERLADDSGSYDSLIFCEDTISRAAAIDALCKRCDLVADVPCTEKCNDIKILEKLPSAQPEPISEAYAKAVFAWLLDYQIKAAEWEGRYIPYEVLSFSIWKTKNIVATAE